MRQLRWQTVHTVNTPASVPAPPTGPIRPQPGGQLEFDQPQHNPGSSLQALAAWYYLQGDALNRASVYTGVYILVILVSASSAVSRRRSASARRSSASLSLRAPGQKTVCLFMGRAGCTLFQRHDFATLSFSDTRKDRMSPRSVRAESLPFREPTQVAACSSQWAPSLITGQWSYCTL